MEADLTVAEEAEVAVVEEAEDEVDRITTMVVRTSSTTNSNRQILNKVSRATILRASLTEV